MHICIVTPGQLGSNPRVVKEADALHSAGHRVTVIATQTLDRVEPRDQSIIRRIPWNLRRIDLRSRIRWRSLRLIQHTARKGFEITKLPVFANLGFSAFTSALTAMALRNPADFYIAHYPAALPAVAAASRWHGVRYAFDAEDFHLGDLANAPEHRLANLMIRSIEGRYLPGAAYVSAASPLIADAYAAEYGIHRPAVVLNVFPRANAPVAPSARGITEPGPSIYWFSQTIGAGRGLEAAIIAISLAKSRPHLYLRGTPAAGYREQLAKLARSHAVEDRLHFLSPAVPDELERLGAEYDLGYAGETGETRNRCIAITNKIFSYLLGGIPILASDIPAHQELRLALGPAIQTFPVGNSDALAAAMDSYLLDDAGMKAARLHAWELAQTRYCWEVEITSLFSALGNLAAPKLEK